MPVRYSKQTEKTGLSIGTVLPIPKPSTWTDSTNLTTETNNWSVSTNYPGWLPCDGRTLNVSDYRALYDVIGTTYGGTGGNTGTFNLPDYRSKKLMGTGPVSLSSAITLTPTVGPGGGSSADVNTPGSKGGQYVLTTTRELPPSSEITPGTPSNPPTIGGSATDTFNLGTYATTGFSSSTTVLSGNISGNISYSVGPIGTRSLNTPAPHQHYVRYVQATGGSGAEGDGSRFCGARGGSRNVGFYNNVDGTIVQFSREGRTLRTHSHYIYWESESSTPYASYGHDDGAGNSGLVNPTQSGSTLAFSTTYNTTNNRGTTINKTLSMTDIAVSVNDANCVLKDSVKTDWDNSLTVRLEAAEEIPLMSSYFRVKYIIKAY